MRYGENYIYDINLGDIILRYQHRYYILLNAQALTHYTLDTLPYEINFIFVIYFTF